MSDLIYEEKEVSLKSNSLANSSDAKRSMTFEEAFDLKFPYYAGQVIFTDHAGKRIEERFSNGINSQVGRAIIKAIRYLKEHTKATYGIGETYVGKLIVSRRSRDRKYVVITAWNKMAEGV